MTERGAIGLARPGHPPATPSLDAPQVVPRAARQVRPATRTADQVVGAVARVGVLVGASTALYAVSLAAVAGLQAADDRAIAEARAPRIEGIDAAAAANDRLEAALVAAGDAAGTLGVEYGSTAAAVAAYQARIAELAALVGEVQGRAAALPSRIALPTVTVRGPSVPAPRTRTTTGASGG